MKLKSVNYDEYDDDRDDNGNGNDGQLKMMRMNTIIEEITFIDKGFF